MAKAVTGVFTITASTSNNAVGYVTTAIPIGSLIDVGDAQALEIEQVDFVYQNYDDVADVYEVINTNQPFASDAAWGCQLTDRNAGTFIIATDNNLIASSGVQYGAGDNITSAATDFYPDDFQRTNGRFVVNDELYMTTYTSLAAWGGQHLITSIRIRAKVVKLSTRDWMAISLETVQNE